MAIDWEEVLAVLRQEAGRPDGCFSSEELARAIGLGRERTRIYIRRAVEQGVLELAAVRWERTVDGRRCRMVPLYRLKERGDGKDSV